MSNLFFPSNVNDSRKVLFQVTKAPEQEQMFLQNKTSQPFPNSLSPSSRGGSKPNNEKNYIFQSHIYPQKQANPIDPPQAYYSTPRTKSQRKEETYLNRDYLNYLEVKGQNEIKKGFQEYIQAFPEWENYEYILILAVSDFNDNFEKFSAHINLYLYENLKRLREPKNTKDFIVKEKNGKDDSTIIEQCTEFYNHKKNEIKQKTGNEINIQDCYNLLIATALIYQKIKNNEELDLTHYYINGDYIQPIISAVKFNDKIQTLILPNNFIGEEGCYWLGTMLRNNKIISKIDLSNCKLTNNCLNMIIKGLKVDENPSSYDTPTFYLKNLNISGNEIDKYGGDSLAKILHYFNYLAWLNISKNKLQNYGFKTLLEELRKLTIIKKTRLETIIIYSNQIQQEDCLLILSEIVSNPLCTLKSLVLSDNNLGGVGEGHLATFFKAMEKNTSIVELLMINCKITNDNVDSITEMFAFNQKLERLCLYNNLITQQEKFMKLLRIFCEGTENNNSTLKELDLSKNYCRIRINSEFLDIIKKIQVKSLDISLNFEMKEDSIETKEFKDVTNNLQNKIKIIY